MKVHAKKKEEKDGSKNTKALVRPYPDQPVTIYRDFVRVSKTKNTDSHIQ